MNATMTVETQYLIQGPVNEAKYAKFVARHRKSIERSILKGHRDWKDTPIERAQEIAESICGMYRHQFRDLVPADPATRKPLEGDARSGQ